jgi:hypothetical protein
VRAGLAYLPGKTRFGANEVAANELGLQPELTAGRQAIAAATLAEKR